jgi:ABC-type nitrate/sulfonate/bicarbonate transport system permease component
MTAGAQMVAVSSRVTRQRSRLPAWYRRREVTILSFSGLIGFVLIWELGARLGGSDFKFFFSSPVGVSQAAFREFQLPRFWEDVGVSAWELAAGSGIALGLGVPIGLAIGWYRRVGYMFDPWLNFFNSLPRIALLPLLVLWLGLGTEMKIAAVMLGAFFSIVVPTAQGVKTVDRSFLDVGASVRASQRRIFTTIVLPATVPFMISGIRIAIGRGLIGVVVAEWYAQTKGVGVIIVKAQQALESDRMLFAIILFTISGIILSYGTSLLERRFQKWRPAEVEE